MKLFVDFWRFIKIWKGLRHRNTELFLFYVPNMQEQSRAGKKSEINRQTSAWYLFSCTSPKLAKVHTGYLLIFISWILGVNEFEVNKKNYTKFVDAYGCLGVLRINEGIYFN